MPSSPLSAPYKVTDEHRVHFRRDGFILLRNVLDAAAVERYRRPIMGVVEDVARTRDTQGRISDYSAMFTQVTNVWRLAEAAREFVFAERFARVAADLMGVKGVRLYHDQVLVKEPGGKPTPWHQDQYYWPLDTDNTVTMWMPLVDVEPKMGTMTFVPGSHRDTSFNRMEISDRSQRYFEELVRISGVVVPSFSLNAGDATFHAGWTLHSAHKNTSDRRREVMTVIYYADGARVVAPDNEHRKVDLDVFIPGRKPGEPADTDLNPLLYPTS
ncbi:MAG: phytanoyl-CoA dioxygenase family protein [Bacteroidetes bacterium]|jgi:ectoine hydroxylase-related dioxygenase (phytanoyl-CoA dioxygenase family)|nr:phytanoyl-CoA dioxygenase family protein [Bacteroidota bacterium]